MRQGRTGQRHYHIVEHCPMSIFRSAIWRVERPLGNAGGLKIARGDRLRHAAASHQTVEPEPLATLYLGVIAEKDRLPGGRHQHHLRPGRRVGKTLNSAASRSLRSSVRARQACRSCAGRNVREEVFLRAGGNAPVIVMPDVDLDEVAANIVAKKTGFARPDVA